MITSIRLREGVLVKYILISPFGEMKKPGVFSKLRAAKKADNFFKLSAFCGSVFGCTRVQLSKIIENGLFHL